MAEASSKYFVFLPLKVQIYPSTIRNIHVILWNQCVITLYMLLFVYFVVVVRILWNQSYHVGSNLSWICPELKCELDGFHESTYFGKNVKIHPLTFYYGLKLARVSRTLPLHICQKEVNYSSPTVKKNLYHTKYLNFSIWYTLRLFYIFTISKLSRFSYLRYNGG